MKRGRRCLTLLKGEHRFAFRYVEGREADLLAAFVALAKDSESLFDWFDAAAMSLQMGRQLRPELDRVI